MSEKPETPNVFDPFGMMKNMRDSNMENWAKAMTEFVNSDSFAAAQAESLNAMLATSTPFRKLLEETLSKSMQALKLPTTDDFVRLAERLTNIEMRLDDMDAKLDQCLESQH
ncbi:hypothetical protein [Bythopirellula polymerisocia]|uniref:Poly(3-hydroxyalkanoate) polymerase subunit PhaE n=1 Tax=Bythopirellula polymerisocia TaxID=2528003 RepID=A0A5C6D3I4_9BACT|nr:hypothetical protein [Bythopirellula polymerisocia]TWU29786.1 hypothetical protein Pla144_05650 [Bythopirellula polymerisocia]